MKIAALLTGRGNNSLKDKNILDILGHPVLYYPCCAARKSKYIDEFYCSSDDDNILNAAKEYGFISIKRPEELAKPTSQHIDCILHALKVIDNKYDSQPDILVVVLANNVTIKSEWIDLCIEKMVNDPSISSVVPVYEDNDHHPLRAKTIGEDGKLQMYGGNINKTISTNRQDLPKCYFLAHNIWVINVKEMLKSNGKNGQQPWTFLGNNIDYLEIDESLDIHKEIDLYIAAEWVKENFNDLVSFDDDNMCTNDSKSYYGNEKIGGYNI